MVANKRLNYTSELFILRRALSPCARAVDTLRITELKQVEESAVQTLVLAFPSTEPGIIFAQNVVIEVQLRQDNFLLSW